MYNVVVLSALCLTLNLVLEDHADLSYGILSAILVTGTTTTQLVVFIPKVNTTIQYSSAIKITQYITTLQLRLHFPVQTLEFL